MQLSWHSSWQTKRANVCKDNRPNNGAARCSPGGRWQSDDAAQPRWRNGHLQQVLAQTRTPECQRPLGLRAWRRRCLVGEGRRRRRIPPHPETTGSPKSVCQGFSKVAGRPRAPARQALDGGNAMANGMAPRSHARRVHAEGASCAMTTGAEVSQFARASNGWRDVKAGCQDKGGAGAVRPAAMQSAVQNRRPGGKRPESLWGQRRGCQQWGAQGPGSRRCTRRRSCRKTRPGTWKSAAFSELPALAHHPHKSDDAR